MTQYLTITLELIQANPMLHERLRQKRELLTILHRLGNELKASHQAWQHRLRDQRPGDDLRLLQAQALELAVAELEERLLSSDSADGTAPPSPDATPPD
jgi:hypothetical protein